MLTARGHSPNRRVSVAGPSPASVSASGGGQESVGCSPRGFVASTPSSACPCPLDFTLTGHGRWVIARRALAAALPAHYVGVLVVRGTGDDPVELQVKLVDPSGANVWWWRRRGFTPGHDLERLMLRKASLEFAWGPASGGAPERLAAVEIALAGGEQGGAGTLWIEALRIEARDPAAAQPSVHTVRASSAAPDHAAVHALTADHGDTWRPAPNDAQPWLELDLGRTCEWGGMVVDFAAVAVACRLLASGDGQRWTPLAEAPGGSGQRRWLRTADGEGTPGAPRVRTRLDARGRACRRRTARAGRFAGALRHRARLPRAARTLPAPSARRAGVLGAGRCRRRRAQGAAQRGRRPRGRRGVVHARALSVDRRASPDLGRRRRTRVARPRPSAHPQRRVALRRLAPACHRGRRRATRPERPRRALRDRAHRPRSARCAPLRRRPPVPGQPGVAEPQPRRRRRTDQPRGLRLAPRALRRRRGVGG